VLLLRESPVSANKKWQVIRNLQGGNIVQAFKQYLESNIITIALYYLESIEVNLIEVYKGDIAPLFDYQKIELKEVRHLSNA
jgi:hypothetical protein